MRRWISTVRPCGRPRGQGDALDLAERQLQEACAERAERVDVAGAQEAVIALAVGPRVAEVARAERVLHLAGERAARRDDLDAAAEHALEHRPDQRVVRAAEDDRVDRRRPQRRDVAAYGLDD